MELYEDWADAEKLFLPEYEEEPEAADDQPVDQALNEEEDEEKENNNNNYDVDYNDDYKRKSAPQPEDLSQMLLSKLNFKKDAVDSTSITSTGTHSGPPSRQSSRSSRASPEYGHGHLVNGESNGHQRTASGSVIPTVPVALRPLLSAILWRLHDGAYAQNASRSCILLSNDRETQVWAQKFGIGTKNIHQLRTAIQYEEKEYKNRCKYVEKTQAATIVDQPKQTLSTIRASSDDYNEEHDNDTDEDELVFVPRGKGGGKGGAGATNKRKGSGRAAAAAAGKPPPPLPLEPSVDIPTQPIDPDSFSRSLSGSNKQASVDVGSQRGGGYRAGNSSRRHSSGRRGGARGSPRGGGSGRGRGKLWVP